jgi:crotonobetainyl-CoA:carnitine CoA-transferase CaiB-like acyl-CoA transferase
MTYALREIWQTLALPAEALDFARLEGADPVLPSSFAVGAAAQAGVAAAALAACELGHVRGAARQEIAVSMTHAALECTGWFSLDGRVSDPWDAFSGLYRCSDGWVRVHANFAHHREGALHLLGLDPGTATRAEAEAAMQHWRALEFEQANAERGLAATALRSFAQWDASAQGRAVATQPLLRIERIGGHAPPLALPALTPDQRPLTGVRALDLTRLLAGPVGGRALAAYGADVMLVNSPHLPNIAAIADTSRGKRSALADLNTPEGRDVLWQLIDGAHVFVQGYRPGGLAAKGFTPEAIAARRPGCVVVSLSAYGNQGPWAARRGFDSLVQTAMGFNHAEGEATGDGQPRALPMQILDQATGYLIAASAAAALWRQQREGGSWHVQLSLAQTGQWLRALGRVPQGLQAVKPDPIPRLERSASGFGELTSLRHSARLARTPATWTLPSMPPGTHRPQWD